MDLGLQDKIAIVLCARTENGSDTIPNALESSCRHRHWAPVTFQIFVDPSRTRTGLWLSHRSFTIHSKLPQQLLQRGHCLTS